MDRRAANLTRGALAFSANESGLDFASFVLGYPVRSQTAEGYPSVAMRSRRVGAYVSDEWKVARNLTVTAGLRFDYMGNPYDELGHVRTVSLERPYTIPGTSTQIPTLFPAVESDEAKKKFWKQVAPFWQPRLGIAYRPAEKWVVRMGAGQYTSPQHFVQISTANLMPPLSGFQQFDSITDPVAGSPTRRFRPGEPIITLYDPFSGTRANPPVSVWRLEPDRQERDVWQWSFDIQRELRGNMSLTVGYVGSKTSHSANSYENFNGALPSPDTNFQNRRPLRQFLRPSTAVTRCPDSWPDLSHLTLIRTSTITASRPNSSAATRTASPSAFRTPSAKRTVTAKTVAMKAPCGRLPWTAPVHAPARRST